MKKRTLGLMLAIILAISVCLPAMAEEETQTNWLSVAPGDCWTVTNTGETDISIDDISRMDYVITDAEGYVTARDVNDPGWHDPLILPAGGQFIVANTGLASLSMIKLEGDIEAEKNEPPALLHADLRFGEACAFKNITDHSANVLLRTESNRAWAYVIYDGDGAVTKKDFFYHGGGSIKREVLSVPAGGRAVITTDGYYLFNRSGSPSDANDINVYCMARAENFSLEEDVSPAWRFGALGCGETAAFTNVSGREQTVYYPGNYALYYAGGESAKLKEAHAGGGEISVPAGYSIALGGAQNSGEPYAFLSDAFEDIDLPAPVKMSSLRTLKVTFTNVSGKAAPFFGITKSKLEKQPEKYAAFGMGVVSASEYDGIGGIMVPKDGKVIVTGESGSFVALSGQYEASVEPIAKADTEVVALAEGESAVITNNSEERRALDPCGIFCVYGDYYKMTEKSYSGYGNGNKLYLNAGQTEVFTAVSGPGSIEFPKGDFSVSCTNESVYKYKVLRPGETLIASESVYGTGEVHPTGNNYYEQGLSSQTDESGTTVTTRAFEANGVTIFRYPTKGKSVESGEPLTRRVSLNKGESVRFTWKEGLVESGAELSRIIIRGAAAYTEEKSDGSLYCSRTAYMEQFIERDTTAITFMALRDGVVIRYCPLALDMEAAEPPYTFETIPKGESRIYRQANGRENDLNMYIYGLNAEEDIFNYYSNDWGDKRRGNSSPHTGGWLERGGAPFKITATDSDVTVGYLTEAADKSPVLAVGAILYSGGEQAEPYDLGKAGIDAADVTIVAVRAEPLKVVLAAYDGEGRLIKTVFRDVSAEELTVREISKVRVPFECGEDTAVIKVMALGADNVPLASAATLGE